MKKTILLTALFAIAISSYKQASAQNMFDWNNRHMSQSNQLNPAFLPQYRSTFSFFRAGAGLDFTGANLNSIFNNTETQIQTATRISNETEKQFGFDVFNTSDLFRFGYRSAKSYFAFNSSVHMEGSVRLPKDIMGLAYFGNAAYIDKDANLNFSGTDLKMYVQNQLSYGRHITNELSVGVNVAMLNGLMHLGLDNAGFNINTDTGVNSIYQMKFNGGIQGNASLLGADVQQLIDSSNYDVGKAIENQLNNYSLSSNRGFAYGFGAVYRLDEKIRLSGSVQNIGSIKWNVGATEISMPNTSWTWSGLDTNQVENLNNDIGQQILDTISSRFDLSTKKVDSYVTKLKPRYTLGAEYFFTPRTYVQLVGGFGFGAKGDKSFVSASFHKELGEIVDVRINYAMYDFSDLQNRLGFGLSLNLGPIQLYGSVNNVMAGVNYFAAQSISGTVGLNINIGTWKDKDNDMVPDKRDSCVSKFGVISNNGCPYGFLGGSMNDDSAGISEAPADEPAPADSAKPNTTEDLPLLNDATPVINDSTELVKTEKKKIESASNIDSTTIGQTSLADSEKKKEESKLTDKPKKQKINRSNMIFNEDYVFKEFDVTREMDYVRQMTRIMLK